MNNAMTLWNERVRAYWDTAIRYLRLIGNSGFLFTVYLLIIIGSYYYSVLLKWLPPSFPAVYVFVILFTYLVTKSKVRTFVKQADAVFLLPYEVQLDRYFRASKWYSFAIQCAIILFAFVILSPLFTQRVAETTWSAGFVLIMLAICKGWNVWTSWEEQRLQSDYERTIHIGLRGIVNAIFVFLLFSGAPHFLLLIMLLIMGGLYFFYYRHVTRKNSLKWEHLIEVEHQMLLSFYKLANAFTDVPALRSKVKPRAYVNGLLRILTYSRSSVYHFLFARTFLRADEYAGIYVRLVCITAIALFFLPAGPLQIVVFLLFLHMVMNQLKILSYHYDTMMWMDLYPVQNNEKKAALTQLSFRLLLLMTCVQVGVLLVSSTTLIAASVLVVGIGYSYIGSHTFIHKRKKDRRL